MDKKEFIDRTLNTLFEDYMPPGMELAKQRIEERQKVPQGLHEAAWTVYEYSEKDRTELGYKLRSAAKKVVQEATHGAGHVELALVSPQAEDAELERVFKANDETKALNLAIEYAEEQGYNVEEPPEGSESVYDYRIDGRRLTKLRG